MSALSSSQTFTKLDFLRLMMLSREGDRREGILLRQSKGWFQVSGMGHEALSALMLPLRADDWFFPHYRDRAMMLMRGMTNFEMALAYFGKAESSSRGRQMPSHFSDRDLNCFSLCTPTGANLLPAAGVAWGMKLENKDTICLACLGDAASRQGEFYEAWSFAVQEKLGIVFVVEDNKYGISTPTEHFLPLNLGGILSEQYVVKVDGRVVDNVLAAGEQAIERARAGEGPTLLWCDLDRLSSHTSSDDQRIYRTSEDLAAIAKRDPILLLQQELIEEGAITQAQIDALASEIAREVDEDYQLAEKAPDPDGVHVFDDIWGEPAEPRRAPIEPGPQTMVESINVTLSKALADDHRVVLFGEDIQDPKGGVFGLTKGLSNAYPNQVFNSPLAEASIIGIGVGLAAYGMKPVFEIQFVDFITPGWNQLATNVGCLRWRTGGAWKSPLVLYAPYGAYLPGGSIWHSQSNEGGLAHLPGIKVAIPSTPEDAAGLFWTAIHGDDPVIILVPKHIFRKRVEVGASTPVPFGKAKTVREGTDVTLVGWGNTLEICEAATAEIGDEASIEIIDLRSIVPCDYEHVARSLEKTGRLVVVQEDLKTCGFGQAVISQIVGNPEWFSTLLASPQLVARDDVHIGFNPIWEYAALPDVPRVVEAIRKTLE